MSLTGLAALSGLTSFVPFDAVNFGITEQMKYGGLSTTITEP